MGWWDQLWHQQSNDWTFGYLDESQVPTKINIPRRLVEPDSEYLSIFLSSMHVVNVRTGLAKFYGTVHSFISVPFLDGKSAQFNVLTTPSNLRDIDAAHIDRVITMNQRLLGPIPYRGGDVELEVGLFSIKSADLAGPFLDVLQAMSKAAGVSYVSVALPFAAPLLEGVKLLTGTQNTAILEVGLATWLLQPETGYMAVIRAQKGVVSLSQLRIDEDYRLVNTSGQSLSEYPYMVLAVNASPNRDAWFQIPELSAAYGDLQREMRGGKGDQMSDALAFFRRTALTCPDLLFDDADRLVQKVETPVNAILAPKPSKGITPPQPLPDLAAIPLY